MELSRKLALTLRVAAVLALGAALVPILAAPAQALPATQIVFSSTNCGSTLTSGLSCSITATLEDAGGGTVIDSSHVIFAQGGSDTGTVNFASVTNNGNGTYSVTVTGDKAGTVSITAADSDHSISASSIGVDFTVADLPTATISSPATGGTYYAGQVVATTFSCTEGTDGPGLASCDDNHGTNTVSGGSGTLDTSATGSLTYIVTATSSDTGTGTASITYTVADLPTATISSPATGGTYYVGQVVATTFSCTEGTDGPGLASCDDNHGTNTVSGGSDTLDTSSPGHFTYTVTATSNDTGTGTASITYTVVTPPPPPPPTHTTITQTAPFSNSTTSAKSASFTNTLTTTGNTGAVTFVTTSAPPGSAGGIKVSSSGVVTTTGALSAATYRASGTDSDSSGDTGTWSFSLTVSATAITQMTPTTGTTSTGKAFTGQLKVSGSHGTVTYTQSTGAPDLKVSSSGKVSAPATLAAGTYKATGTVKDTSGDTGTWGYSLTVVATKFTQVAPTSATTTPGQAFTGQLKVSGSHGAVSYAQSTGAPDLKISASGVVSAPATLTVGTYKATGSDKDTLGDTGTWSFTLTATSLEINQIAPTTATTTLGKAFTGQLRVSGEHGAVTYTQATGAPQLTVSSSGVVSGLATLTVGTYKATGGDKDTLGDTGTWSFTLTATSLEINQAAPTTATTTLGRAFTGQLEVVGAHGTVTYAQTSGAPDLTVSSSGKVSAPANLAAGTYRATGTVEDSSDDTGTWSFALTVSAKTIAQAAPITATTTTGKAFSGQLAFSGAHGTVTYAQTSGAPDLTVSSSGKVSAPANLAAGTYRATGTVEDSSDDTGTWSFALTVSAKTIAQAAPITATTTTGKAFSGQLAFSDVNGKVTFAQTAGAPQLTVSSSGEVSATADSVAGIYKATGTAKDASGDAGAWSFSLTVTATKLLQSAPATASTTTGKAISGQLEVSDAHGAVTYAESAGAPDLNVSSSGKVSATASLVAGTYKATGTERDSLGDTGNWRFAVTVVATKLTQVAPVKTSTTTGQDFTGQLQVSGAHGAVTYAQSTGSLVLKVSSSGKVATTASLVAGTYKATGVVRDVLGDSGSWSFDLTVVATKLTQVAPVKASTKTGKTLTGQLRVSGAHGTVTYAQSAGGREVKVSSSGKISAAVALAAGTYKATGTVRDSFGDTGKWGFVLAVVATRLAQMTPLTASTKTGKAFTGQLQVSGAHGTVTYAQSSGAPNLTVLSSGKVSTTATLVAGTYKATGTARDTLGDIGSWSLTLTVVATELTQVAPDTATNTVGKTFTSKLKVSGASGTVTFTQLTGAPHVKVSSSGKISAAAGLATGIYKATGTVKDTSGDTGKWTFTLTVKGSKLTQIAPTTGQTTIGEAFTSQLEASGSHGTVTYDQLTGAPYLKVSPSGTISAPATLAAGTYKSTGKARDSLGDVETWTYTLTVASPD